MPWQKSGWEWGIPSAGSVLPSVPLGKRIRYKRLLYVKYGKGNGLSVGVELVDLAAIEQAFERINGVANRTPVQTSRTVDGKLGASVFFKCENFQRTGSFKFRGAYNALSLLSEDERKRGV
ncbi:MAG: pyridoxal-phosphate dependent enzyme, partial [Thermoplasmata archaeon]